MSSPVTCIFCEISQGRAPADVILDDDVATAFLDRSPLFAGHTLVVPRVHAATLADLDADLVGPFWLRVQHLARYLPGLLGAQGSFVANNNTVSQSVSHLHVHVVPRTKGDGLRGFFWPRIKYSEGDSAALAARLRAGLRPFEIS